MTVKDLIAKLKQYPADTPVIVAHDAEGNDFSPLADFSLGEYLTHVVRLTNDRRAKTPEGTQALILWPE